MQPQNPIAAAFAEIERQEQAFSLSSGPLGEDPPRRGPAFRGLKAEAGVRVTPQPSVTLEQARDLIWNKMNEYLAESHPGHMLLVNAPPGLGKTALAVTFAMQQAVKGQRLLYCGPRHNFFGDVTQEVERTDPARVDDWYEWLGRNHLDADKLPDMCKWSNQITSWITRGYNAMDFCTNPRVCGWAYVNDGCPWHAQKRRKEPIIFGQHQHITGGHPLMELVSAVIGDENPLSAFLWEWTIPAAYIVPAGMDVTDPMTHLLHELQDTAARNTEASGPDLLKLLGGAEAVKQACEQLVIPAHMIAYAPSLSHPNRVEDLPYFHLFQTARLLLQESRLACEGTPYGERVIVKQKQLQLLLKRPVTPTAVDKHIIWLDATGEQHVYEELFQREVKVIQPRIEMQGRIFQVWDRTNGKYSLMQQEKKADTDEPQRGPSDKFTQLNGQIDHIISTYGYTKPAVITFQALESLLTDIEHTHFYGARGTNQFVDCDCMIVAGTPQPSVDELAKMGLQLFQRHVEAFKPEWSERDVPYEGQPFSYPVSGFWHDPDLNALLWQYREAEIIQSAHRVRPALRTCDIWLLTNVPIAELPPTRLMSIRELFGAPQGVDPFIWPEVVRIAEEREAKHGWVTAPDLVDALGCTRTTAGKYIDLLVQQCGWQSIHVPAAHRGKPPKAAGKG